MGKNARMNHRHSRTPSRPNLFRRESTTSDVESISGIDTRDESIASGSQQGALLTPTHSVPSTPSLSMFPPPPVERPSSRRSSFSGSNAPSSPATYTRYARSPSPMPALPAIRMPTSWSNVKLYGDESYTNFFRRLTFSPDGALLLTPAGQFEDPSVIPGLTKSGDDQSGRGRKGHPSSSPAESNQTSTSSVYIYSRANFARPPVARLPGHKKASVAVKFSPILYDLRAGVTGAESPVETRTVAIERGSDKTVDVDVVDRKATSAQTLEVQALSPNKLPALSPIIAPSPRVAGSLAGPLSMLPPSPALSATDSLRPSTPSVSKPATPAITPNITTASVFALPYRMLYAIATMDTIAIHDTQQASPVCLLTKLHYDEFTDMTWYVISYMMSRNTLITFAGRLMGSASCCHHVMGTAQS